MNYAFVAVDILSTLTVVANIVTLAVLIALIAKKDNPLSRLATRNALLSMFIVALVATLGSLFFSEIAGWTPCKLCWLQRIFMYPQAVILAMALWKKDASVARYILALSIIGAMIAIYHYGEQVQATLFPVDTGLEPCDATGESCAKREFDFAYGYITIPMMAFSAFIANIVTSIALMRRENRA